ncbi:hypothetical protein [Pseudomonas nicosulfuronedens]
MSNAPIKRYDTLVIRGATNNEVPREAAGGEVVAWSAGHALAESGPLEEFVTDLADGAFSSVDAIEAEAWRVLELSRRQREHGWIDNEEKKNG